MTEYFLSSLAILRLYKINSTLQKYRELTQIKYQIIDLQSTLNHTIFILHSHEVNKTEVYYIYFFLSF